MQKKGLRGIIFFTFLVSISFVSAMSIGELLDTFGFDNMLLVASFLISFVLINFALGKVLKDRDGNPNKTTSGIAAFALSMLIVYGIHQKNFDLAGFFYKFGVSQDFLQTIIPLAILLGVIYLIWKYKRNASLILGILAAIAGFTNFFYMKYTFLFISAVLLIIWFIMENKSHVSGGLKSLGGATKWTAKTGYGIGKGAVGWAREKRKKGKIEKAHEEALTEEKKRAHGEALAENERRKMEKLHEEALTEEKKRAHEEASKINKEETEKLERIRTLGGGIINEIRKRQTPEGARNFLERSREFSEIKEYQKKYPIKRVRNYAKSILEAINKDLKSIEMKKTYEEAKKRDIKRDTIIKEIQELDAKLKEVERWKHETLGYLNKEHNPNEQGDVNKAKNSLAAQEKEISKIRKKIGNLKKRRY